VKMNRTPVTDRMILDLPMDDRITDMLSNAL